MSTDWFFFPCIRGTKRPALAGDWRLHSTNDEAQIDAWEAEGYNLAIDTGKSGLAVIDLDGGPVGRAAWEALGEEHGHPPDTFTVRTPKGGLHLYFTGNCPSSVQKLGEKVDVRSAGGYVLYSGATPEGQYVVERDLAVAKLPGWVFPALNVSKSEHKSSVEQLDLAVNVARAERFLRDIAPAIEGRGGDARTYEVACAVLDLAVSPDKALELMLAWNERCVPPWEPEDLQVKISNAASYQQNEPGAWGVTSGVERFASVRLDPVAEPDPGRDKYRIWSTTEAIARPPPTYLFPGILPAQAVAMTYGPQETGKTWIVLDQALHLASGAPGWGRPESEPRDVLFYSGEGFDDLIHNRVTAWCEAKGYALGDLKLHLLEDIPDFGDDADTDLLIQAVIRKGIQPAMMVLDTYARVMAQAGLSENDPLEVMRFIRQAELLKRGFGCTVVPIHHTGKDVSLGARGSNTLIAAVDAAYEVSANWDVMAFQLRCEKMKGGVKPKPMHFEADSVGKGLVLRGVTPDYYRGLTAAEDDTSPAIVGKVIAKLAPRGSERGVTSQVLATELHAAPIDEDPGQTQARIATLVRKLNAAARGRLEVYADRDHKDILWRIPGGD